MVTYGKVEGFIHRYTDINVFKSFDKAFSSHGYGVAEALRLAEAINGLPKKVVIHGIEIGEEEILTPQIIKACDQLADNIIGELSTNPNTQAD